MSDEMPVTDLDRAQRRRAELLAEKARCVTAMKQWVGRARTEAVARDKEIESELAALKVDIRRLSLAEKHGMERFVVVTDGIERMRALKAAMGGVWEYVEFLERENAELRAENERLTSAGEGAAPIEF